MVVRVKGTTTVFERDEGRIIPYTKETEIVYPDKKGPFPSFLMEHCKDCPKIYCGGWTVEGWQYHWIWHCDKWTVQRKRTEVNNGG